MVPTIELSARVAAPASLVFRLLSESERFPGLCPQVEAVRLLWRAGPRAVSHWRMRLGGVCLGWTQRERFDPSTRRISYRLAASGGPGRGGVARLEGQWLVAECSECSSLVTASLALTLAPSWAEQACGGRVRREMRRAFEGLLEAACRLLEGPAARQVSAAAPAGH